MRDVLIPDCSRSAIGTRLRLTRQVFGLGQYAFAEKAGLAGNTYNQYEQAKKRPTIENALAICTAFDLTLDWIYAGDTRGLSHKMAEAIEAVDRVRG